MIATLVWATTAYSAAVFLIENGEWVDVLAGRELVAVKQAAKAARACPIPSVSKQYTEFVTASSLRYGVEAKLIEAVIACESAFNENALSRVGAVGLMQLMPTTASDLGVDPNQPQQNIDGGTKYLSQMFDTFADWQLALAAYNAGPSQVKNYNGVPPFRETINYVARVNATYKSSKGDYLF